MTERSAAPSQPTSSWQLPLPHRGPRRVAELEGLLAGMRAREFRSELSVDKSGSQLAMLEQRNRLLEEQVRAVPA